MFSSVPSSTQLNTSVFFLLHYDSRNYLQISNVSKEIQIFAAEPHLFQMESAGESKEETIGKTCSDEHLLTYIYLFILTY